VRDALSRLLAAKAERTSSFRAPSRGRLILSWESRRVEMGDARRRFDKAGAARVTLPLNAGGKRLMKSVKRLSVLVRAVFKPVGEPAVRGHERFRLTLR
jgi:hypothetical protein